MSRTSLRDALDRPIPVTGPLSVWLDDDLVDRAAPEGWVHVISAREACLLLQTGRVERLSLDHDIGDGEFGSGDQVIDWLDEMMGAYSKNYWPKTLQLHTANPSQRDSMARAILSARRNHGLQVSEQARSGVKREFTINPPE